MVFFCFFSPPRNEKEERREEKKRKTKTAEKKSDSNPTLHNVSHDVILSLSKSSFFSLFVFLSLFLSLFSSLPSRESFLMLGFSSLSRGFLRGSRTPFFGKESLSRFSSTKTNFDWSDPFLFEDQLTEEEREITRQVYCFVLVCLFFSKPPPPSSRRGRITIFSHIFF